MKKTVIFFSIIIYLLSFIPSDTFAATSSQSAQISKIENELYGFDFLNESLGERIGRLEASIYGKSNTVQPPAYVVNIWRRTK